MFVIYDYLSTERLYNLLENVMPVVTLMPVRTFCRLLIIFQTVWTNIKLVVFSALYLYLLNFFFEKLILKKYSKRQRACKIIQRAKSLKT